jgi:hypothetical protein
MALPGEGEEDSGGSHDIRLPEAPLDRRLQTNES